VACQVERSQHKNRELAMKMLRSKFTTLKFRSDAMRANKLDETKLEFHSAARSGRT